MLFVLILFSSVFRLQALAGEGLMVSREAMVNAIQQAQQLQKESAKTLVSKLIDKRSAANLFGNIHNHQSCPSQNLKEGKNANKGCIKNIAPQILVEDESNQILVFISFSIPDVSLKSLFQEAQKYNAVLVMRGLYQDSFAQTAQKLQEIGVTIDINPELFEVHNITSVPTFILLKNGHPTHTLRGNVTLEFAAQKFKDQNFKEVS